MIWLGQNIWYKWWSFSWNIVWERGLHIVQYRNSGFESTSIIVYLSENDQSPEDSEQEVPHVYALSDANEFLSADAGVNDADLGLKGLDNNEDDLGVELLGNEYTNYDYHLDVTDSTIKLLKELKHQSKRSTQKLQEFCKYSLLLF